MFIHNRSSIFYTGPILIVGILSLVFLGTSYADQHSGSSGGSMIASAINEFKVVFMDTTYDFELRRALGYSVSGGADINECLYTARRIKEGDDESWYREWRATADRVMVIGEKALAAGKLVSAREAYLRASNYYRTAEFFLRAKLDDPRILETWRLSRDCFLKAAKLIDHPVERVKVPWEGTTLPGYIMKPDKSNKPRKTLVVHTGFDGTGEELYFEVAFFALKRGYNVLIFEGPGQGAALREQGLYFRPDWEKVVTPVLDFAMKRRDIDPKRIALLGISMGGYLAPRAAAFEHRLAAVVANPGVHNLLDAKSAPTAQEKEKTSEDPALINKGIREMMQTDSGFRWWIQHGMFSFGKKEPFDLVTALSEYHLDEVAGLIKCPTLVIVSENDHFHTTQAQEKLYDLIKAPKTLMWFTNAEMAGEHCQMGSVILSNQKILDWLDDTLGKIGGTKARR